MNNRIPSYTYWPASYSYTAIAASVVTGILIVGFFGTMTIAPIWIATNLVIVALYFIAINIVSVRSENFRGNFTWRLFGMAWLTRLLFMAIIVLLARAETGNYFYVGAVDAIRYNRVGMEISQLIDAARYNDIFPHLAAEYLFYTDNYGVPLLLGLIYSIFGKSIIVGKIFYTLVGSGTVIFVYKTARIIWDESIGRLAGIMMAFFPVALVYSSVILKEELVVFLVMATIYLLTKSSSLGKIGIGDLLLMILCVTFVFLLRTAAGALLVSLILGTYLLNRVRGSFLISFVVCIVVLLGFFYFLDVFGEVDYYVDRVTGVTDYSQRRLETISGENTLATIVGIPVFVLLSFVAPFPSFVYIPLGGLSHDINYYLISGVLVWNFLIYFGLIGFWKVFWTKRNESLPVWGFAVGYSIILGVTALFTAERFAYNAMPAFIILIAAGVHHRKEYPYWKWFLVGIIGLIFVWNYFKLAGRGMV